MQVSGWHVLGEIDAGQVWAAVCDHPHVDGLDRTHVSERTSIGFWLSRHTNGSNGRFMNHHWRGGHVPLGRVVAIPALMPLHVQSDASPSRVMLHCRLPASMALQAEKLRLESCLDLNNHVIRTSLARIAREVTAPGFGTSAIVEGLGLFITGELERTLVARGPSRRKGGLAPWQLRRIDDYIRGGHWDCSVSEIANLFAITPGHVMRAFRQSTGKSIATHIAALRAAEACRLLGDGGSSIAQIAARLHFANPSAFASAFRRSVGMTPSRFRQMAILHPDEISFSRTEISF